MVLSSEEINFLDTRVEIRKDAFLEVVSRISLRRKERSTFQFSKKEEKTSEICIFCKENLQKYVKTSIDGKEYKKGESIIFYNKYPFASHHLVGLLSEKHTLEMKEFSHEMFENLLILIKDYYEDMKLDDSYTFYFNMNFSPAAGASQAHPHIQAYIEKNKSKLHEIIEKNEKYFLRWLKEHKEKELVIERKKVKYIINYVPVGNNNITLYTSFNSSKEMLKDENIKTLSKSIINIIHFYGELNESNFNFSIFPTKKGTFGFFITRNELKDKCINDRGFMETLLQEIVVNTDPKEISKKFLSFLKKETI